MKVIKAGREISKTMEVECKTCGAILEVEASDLHKHRIPVTIGEPVSDKAKVYYTYTCACCARVQRVEAEELTEAIKFELSV